MPADLAAGVRSNPLDREGNFLNEGVDLAEPHSYPINNYSSPGATGARLRRLGRHEPCVEGRARPSEEESRPHDEALGLRRGGPGVESPDW
jgi:hypothetical protein